MSRRITGSLSVLLLVGCAQPPVEIPRFDLPSQPLRAEAVRGIVRAEARIADYEMTARLDEEHHRIAGTARLRWQNTSDAALEQLSFHLYMNGFRGESTAWMQTSYGRHRRNLLQKENAWGYIDIESIRLENLSIADPAEPVPDSPPEEDSSEAAELAWDEGDEPSTMTVDLPSPLPPGGEVTLTLDFTTQLPQIFARTGYYGDFHAVAQWYPKIGVVLPDGSWDTHTFTINDEFFANFGNYTVEIDVPQEMVVGATGVQVGEEVSGERKKLTFHAQMVHDFVWMGDNDFVVYDGRYEDVLIRQLIQPERVADAQIHLDALVADFESYERRFGPYPWSALTVVHPPAGAPGAAAMEYPTIVTTSDRFAIPEWIRENLLDERLSGTQSTLHEFGHQYFQGMHATREYAEPWLDEGINTATNYLALMDRLGDDPWVARFRNHEMNIDDMARAAIHGRSFYEATDLPASAYHWFMINYASTAYYKPAAMVMTLRNLVGAESFDTAMRKYADEFRFRHPTGEDFVRTMIEELGARVEVGTEDGEPVELDLQRYFDQALRSKVQMDFRVVTARNIRRPGDAGWRRDATGALMGGEPPELLDQPVTALEEENVLGIVGVQRVGEMVVPVEIRVEFTDGSEERILWDSNHPTRVYEWPGRRVRSAAMDPDRKLTLEWDRLDNTAIAHELGEGDGLSEPLGDMVETLSLAFVGGLGL